MTRPLLSTKITLPPLGAAHIPRPRLLDAIALHPQSRLILLSAPAGFGKTSCLLEWVHALQASGTRVAWYALDAQDNDPARFAAYLRGAFLAALGDSPHLNGETAAHPEEVLTGIVNALAGDDRPVTLVLDDYHLITAPEVHAALGLALEHLPPNLRVAIGSRADPPLQLSRLRARGQVAEVRAADLRFNPAEIVRFFERALGLTPSAQHVGKLDRMSEGWAAALRLMTLSLDSAGQPVDDAAVERLLRRYSRAHQHIFDYFADEVFAQQDADARRFLLETGILNRLTPDLCAAVTGSCAAPLLLERLSRGGLFLIPLSDVEPVFRYHHLAEDFLRQRLRLEAPERFRDLHRAAAAWFEARGELPDAVRHALEAEDYALAAWLIEERAWEALTSRGEIMTILSWLPRFTEAFLADRPRLSLYFSRALYLTGDIERSAVYVALAQAALDAQPADAPDQVALRTIALNYQATLAAYQGRVSEARELVGRALPHRQAVDPLGQVRLVDTAGFVHYLTGDISEARRWYEEASALAQAIEHVYLTVDAEYYLAEIERSAGLLTPAQDRCERLLERYPRPVAPLSAMMIPLAAVVYERGDALRAEALLREAVAMTRRANMVDILWPACMQLAELLARTGRFDEALTFTRQSEAAVAGFRSPMMRAYVAASQARVLLLQRRLDEAGAWADAYTQAPPPPHTGVYEALTLARVRLAQDQPEQALAVLEPIRAQAVADGRHGHALEAALLAASALQRIGQGGAALDTLRGVLPVAQAGGYLRLFVDAGTPILRLLRALRDQGARDAYITRVIDAFDADAQPVHPAEAVTERERDVLRLLAQGATNQEIVDALVISLGTVKSHINHIMTKLDARNRTEAVARARALGILDP